MAVNSDVHDDPHCKEEVETYLPPLRQTQRVLSRLRLNPPLPNSHRRILLRHVCHILKLVSRTLCMRYCCFIAQCSSGSGSDGLVGGFLCIVYDGYHYWFLFHGLLYIIWAFGIERERIGKRCSSILMNDHTNYSTVLPVSAPSVSYIFFVPQLMYYFLTATKEGGCATFTECPIVGLRLSTWDSPVVSFSIGLTHSFPELSTGSY